MTTKRTQEKQLLALLNAGARVTPLQALRELGIGRLAARIYDLRKRGVAIESEKIEVQSQHGTSRVCVYWIDTRGSA